MDDDEIRHRTGDSRGARAIWFAGLSAIAGFVLLSPLISLTATVMTWGARRRTGALSDRNGVVAVNWQLTYLALQLMPGTGSSRSTSAGTERARSRTARTPTAWT